MSGVDLMGRRVFVTGPAKGMGPAICRTLAAAGARLALAGRDMAAIEPLAAELDGLAVRCDVTDEASVEAAVSTAWDGLGSGHWALVNVAGATGPAGKMLWEHSLAEIDEVFRVNVFGSVLTMKAMLPRMIAERCGEVVNIGGTFGFKGVRQASAYGATKWALRGFTKSAALEAGEHGIRVNMVSPGGVEGPRMSRQMAEEAARLGRDADEMMAEFAGRTALGRLSTDADVANAVLYLLSDLSRNVTGQDLLVDGGTVV